jgi:hypothetical protein
MIELHNIHIHLKAYHEAMAYEWEKFFGEFDIENTVNVYWAFRAILREVRTFNQQHETPIRSILCPALGTGEGRMPYARCAWQMYYAYAVVVLGRKETMGGLAGAVRGHIELLK